MERRQGDKVPAGSLAADRVLRLEVVSEPGNNAIDRILHLIEEAETQRAPSSASSTASVAGIPRP